MKQKVVFVIRTSYPLANVGQWRNWAKVLRESGWDVVVVILEDATSTAPMVECDGTRQIRVSIRKRELHGWRRLQNLILGEQADVLHFWDCPPVMWWLARHFSGALIETRTHVAEGSSTRWLRKKLRPSDLLLSFEPRLLDDTGVLARRSMLIHKSPLPAERSRETTRAHLIGGLELPGDSILVSASARWLPATQCKDLIWAVDLLTCIRQDIQLLLMGHGVQRIRLEKFARQTEVASRIHFMELPENAVDVVAASDVFWQADLTEYQPEGALVAMAHRVPLVAAHGPATASLVLPQKTALPIRPGAREQLARWTKFLLELPDRREQLVEQASMYIEREFTAQRMRQAVQEAYHLPPVAKSDS